MPTQKFAPMSKEFATLTAMHMLRNHPGCGSGLRTGSLKTSSRRSKNTIWFDPGRACQLIVNGKAAAGIGSQRLPWLPRHEQDVLSLAGPGIKHDIQRTLNVRNLRSDTALTEEQADYLDHQGSYDPSRACATWTSKASTR